MYSKLPLSSSQPGLIIILIDQSESMQEPYGLQGDRQQFAAYAVNRCIYDILSSCRAGEKIKDRCHVVAIGYGQVTELLVAGAASKLNSQIKRRDDRLYTARDPATGHETTVRQVLPIWVDPRAENGTPMEEAFDMATELIGHWIQDYRNSFPPVVINITDGEPNEPALAVAAAQRLSQIQTNDGPVLLLNAHIGEPSMGEIKLPHTDQGFPNDFAKMLFGLSSVLPPAMLALAKNSGFNAQEGARGFVMNAAPETLTKLLAFGSLTARR